MSAKMTSHTMYEKEGKRERMNQGVKDKETQRQRWRSQKEVIIIKLIISAQSALQRSIIQCFLKVLMKVKDFSCRGQQGAEKTCISNK